MPTTDVTTAAAITTSECTAIFVSLELSRSTWLMTALAAPLGGKLSRHQVRGGDVPELLKRFSDLQSAVQRRTGQVAPVIVIQEAGPDGFWIHRALVAAGLESHVVDLASIAVSRRNRRAKTDRIDGDALVRTLMAWRRGEPRVCAMVPVPTPEEEDCRRVCWELKTLIRERIRHVNRVKGVLFAQGIGDYEPRNKDRRDRLLELRTGDRHPLPAPLAVRPWHPIRVWVEPDRQGTTLLQGFDKGRPVPGLVARRDGSAHAPKLPGWTHEMNAPSPLRNKVRDQHSIRVENTASRINAGVS